ncbi:ParB/RepB/Spo0J family partition protein [Beduinella massiliensis]|uniref:ParB/RepB/Spo0J family partition protein n=1 Tax=Beduinella massiliensis TaxID=1852363 RepID=UPI000C83A37C
MADETKITGTGETPAPESHEPETPGPPTAEQGVIPGIDNPPASSDKVTNLSDVLEGAGGGDEAAVTDKKDPPAPEVTDSPDGPTQRGKSLEDDDRQEWEIPSAELEARKQKPKRGRPPKTQDTPSKGKRAAPGKAGRAPKAADKGGSTAENPPAPTVDPPEPRDASSGVEEKVEYINLSELHPSPLNPFGVRDDVEMQALVESVKTGRVNQPALVRPHPDGGYEIIAGHRRHKASELAGYFNMPCIVRQMTDDEAIIAMTDDNLRHREKLLPSEKALAIKQQYEAIKHQGARGDDEEAGKLSLAQVGERNGMSIKTVQRYLWLDDLVPELKKTMDEGKLSFTPAVEISRIRPKLQKYIAASIDTLGSPSQGQAKRMRELDKKKELNTDVVDTILSEVKKKEDRNVIITGAELEKYFGPEAPVDEMKGQILALLDEWKEKQPPELGKGDKKVDMEKE